MLLHGAHVHRKHNCLLVYKWILVYQCETWLPLEERILFDGLHGYAMGFQYNGKLRSAEILLKPNGDIKQIRRAETIDDYNATLDYSEFR